jgi:IclR family transcriptional regulator, acetate operon repressor
MAGATTSEPAAELNTYSIRAVQRVCDLLDLLQREPEGVSLVRAAEVTRLPKSSAFRYLATLEARRYVERDEASGEYRIGLALLPLQARQLDVVTQRARPYLEELQREFGETANLGLLDGNRVVYLDIVESEHTMRLAARPGDHDVLHATALGKAIAAQLPLERVRAILRAEGMPRCTEHTITKQRDFLVELERIRSQGYAVDDGENEIGGRCVGVTIPGVTLPLAISISAPAARFAKAQVPAVAARLEEASARLGADLAPASA